MWPHARHVDAARTGHLGLITRPAEFADVVTSFLDQSAQRRNRPGGVLADPLVREIPGAGWSARGAVRQARRRTARRGGLRASAADAGRHHAHQGGVPVGQGPGRHRVRGAAVQLPRRGHERGRLGQRPRGAGRLPRRRGLHGGATPRRGDLGRGLFLRVLHRAHGRRRRSPRVHAHRDRASGRSLRLRGGAAIGRSRSSSFTASATS